MRECFAVFRVDENRAGSHHRLTARGPEGKEQPLFAARLERTQAAAAGASAARQLLVRGVSVAGRGAGASHLVGHFLWHSANDEIHDALPLLLLATASPDMDADTTRNLPGSSAIR